VARQRFIHPEIWKDPVFGRLQPQEQVLFIGLFSIADDDGRTNADPAYLRSELFAYKDYTAKKVKTLRDSVVAKVPSVHLYHAKGVDLIALLKWDDYQKPKYRKPSKLAAPFLELEVPIVEKVSANVGESLGEASPETAHGFGLGRDGLGRAVPAGESVEENAAERPGAFKIPNLRKVDAA
jgi:hypothetical protein